VNIYLLLLVEKQKLMVAKAERFDAFTNVIFNCNKLKYCSLSSNNELISYSANSILTCCSFENDAS